MMSRRYLLLLPVVAFAVLGGVGYVAGMPKPAAMVSEQQALAAPAAASVTFIGDVAGAADAVQPRPDQEWLLQTGAATSIPVRALEAYANAAYLIGTAQPDCHLGWNTVAAIGEVESSHAGGDLTDDGVAEPAIIGEALDGSSGAIVADTDRGGYDGDSTWDRVVGPLRFTPSVWATQSVDADGDGVVNPQDIDDAALVAAYVLCQRGDLSTPEGWREALFAYNNSDSYVERVREVAAQYAAAVAAAE